MYSSASCWHDRRCVWSISHDAQDSIFDLSVVGQPPTSFDAIRDDLLSRQEAEGGIDADVDFVFEIPLQLAKAIVGFKHDEETPWSEPGVLQSMQDIAPKKKPWWKLW